MGAGKGRMRSQQGASFFPSRVSVSITISGKRVMPCPLLQFGLMQSPEHSHLHGNFILGRLSKRQRREQTRLRPHFILFRMMPMELHLCKHRTATGCAALPDLHQQRRDQSLACHCHLNQQRMKDRTEGRQLFPQPQKQAGDE